MMLRDQPTTSWRRAENGEEIFDGDFRQHASEIVEYLRLVTQESKEEEYRREWVPIPDAVPLQMEVSDKLSLNPVSNMLKPNELLHGQHLGQHLKCGEHPKSSSLVDRWVQISIMSVSHVPDTKYYCFEDTEGYLVSRDEVHRLQQMSRQLPFDQVMSSVGPPEPGKLYWVIECDHGQQRVRTESRNRTEPSFATTVDIAIPRSHTEASKVSISISLWDEKGPVGRNGFHQPVKIGATIVYYQQILQILRSERTHMPEVLKLNPQNINEPQHQDDGVQRNATWLPLQVISCPLYFLNQDPLHPSPNQRFKGNFKGIFNQSSLSDFNF